MRHLQTSRKEVAPSLVQSDGGHVGNQRAARPLPAVQQSEDVQAPGYCSVPSSLLGKNEITHLHICIPLSHLQV